MTTKDEDDSDNGYTRCRFTLTPDIDKKLDNLADSETGGNRSALVRKAILEKHRRGDLNLLQDELQRVIQQLEALNEVVEELPDQQPTPRYREPLDEFDPSGLMTGSGSSGNAESGSTSPAKVARELRSLIPEAGDDPISLGELLADLNYPHSTVAAAIHLLIDRDAIEQLDRENALEYRSTND